jgi:hypothetical protein
MNRRPGGVQFSAKRIVICVLSVVRLGVRISSRANVLKVGPGNRRFVSGKSARTRPGRFASREKDCAKRCERSERGFEEVSAAQFGSPKSY